MTPLSAKLASLKEAQIIDQLNQLLEHADVFVSWWGQRMVRIPGYSGAVPINIVAEKYFQASLFPLKERINCCERLWTLNDEIRERTSLKLKECYERISSATLKERLDYYNLWATISLLYQRSEKELEKTKIYHYFTPTLERKIYFGWTDVEARIRGRLITFPMKEAFLTFSLAKCLTLGPDHQRLKEWKQSIPERVHDKFTITPQMLITAVESSLK